MLTLYASMHTSGPKNIKKFQSLRVLRSDTLLGVLNALCLGVSHVTEIWGMRGQAS